MLSGERYESVFQRLLASSELQPLSKFKSYKALNLTYPDALKYPQFFNNNLLAQGRVIKVVRGRNALIRAFCYQLMKLTFQIEVVGIDYVDVFKSVVFLPALLQEDSDVQSPSSGRAHTDRQYKRILADFVELMGQQSIPNFELTVMEYPIVEEALTRTIEALVARCYDGGMETEEMLEWLSRTFQVGVERHGKCYRFEESDVFLYEENPEEFYISYLNEMAEVSDYSESTHRVDGRLSREEERLPTRKDHNISPHRNSSDLDDYGLPHPSDKYRYSAQVYARRADLPDPPNYRRTIDNLELIKDLGREVDESVHNDKPSDKQSKIGSLLDIMSDRSSKEYSSKDLSQPYKASEESSSLPLSDEERKQTSETPLHIHPLEEEQRTPHFSTNHYLQEDHYNPFTKKYSELYMRNLYQRSHEFFNHQPNTSHFNAYSLANNHHFQSSPNPNPNPNPFPTLSIYKPESNSYKGDSYNPTADYLTSSNYSFQPNDIYSNPNHANYRKNVLIDSLEDFKPRPVVEHEEIFYKPKSNKRFEKGVDFGREEREDSRGTIYRQFTDTRVLERNKIDRIRKKYRGVHRKDLKRFH